MTSDGSFCDSGNNADNSDGTMGDGVTGYDDDNNGNG